MSLRYESIKELEEFTRKMPFPWLQMQSNAKHGVATIKKGHVNMHWSTPASWVSGPTWMEGLAPRIDAFKYAEDAIALDGVKYASISVRSLVPLLPFISFLVYPLCYLLPSHW